MIVKHTNILALFAVNAQLMTRSDM